MIDPTETQIRRLLELPDEEPVVMVNLLRFKPEGGTDSYERYAAEVQSHLDRVGASVVYIGAGRELVIGDDERPWWDAIVVARYPSIAAFLTMVGDPEYQRIAAYRTAALDRAELIATAPGRLVV